LSTLLNINLITYTTTNKHTPALRVVTTEGSNPYSVV
jgi:hypothetical protein